MKHLCDTDVLVVGGGPAGIGAALGASRAGAKALLLERHAFFGGIASFCLGMPISQMLPGGRSRSAIHDLVIRRLLAYGDQAVRVGTIVEGKAFPIASARLAVEGTEQAQPPRPDDKAVTFRLELKAGPAKIHGWFCDAQGKEVCGAFFAYVRSPGTAG